MVLINFLNPFYLQTQHPLHQKSNSNSMSEAKFNKFFLSTAILLLKPPRICLHSYLMREVAELDAIKSATASA